MGKMGIIFAILALMLVLIAIWFLAGVKVSMSAEQLDYEVMDDLGDGVELRQYGSSTFISAEAKDSNSAFRILAGYIFGNNDNNVRIAMTSPVISRQEGNVLNMSFVLPKGYDVDNAPMPLSGDVSIHDVAPRKLAVITFSGYATESRIASQRLILEENLSSHGLSTKGEFFLMRYNPPWVPPVIMRNEIAVEVE
ncbi:heme-binding protein [Methanolobus sp. ZRKC3]|uniref:SOUL family heme-binding protein n=1 Tax=Methanolobus sp. ZRKC3 TaxID=3125786 RepID=UPI00324BBE2C